MASSDPSATSTDLALLAVNFAKLDTFELLLVVCLVAFAIYSALEGFFSDYAGSSSTYTTGHVVSENSKWGEDWKHFTVEFETAAGEVHTIRKVSHPMRTLDIGEPVTVWYPIAAPHKGKVRFSGTVRVIMKAAQIGGSLLMIYIILSRA